MARYAEAAQVYEVMELFVRRCLCSNGSLQWDEEDIWTEQHVSMVIDRFIGQPDESDRSFWEKLEEQLDGLPTPCYQVMADAFLIYALPSSVLQPSTKKNNIITVCKMAGIASPDWPSPLREGFSYGFATTSRRYYIKFPQIALILLMAKEVKSHPDSAELLNDAKQTEGLLDRCLDDLEPAFRGRDMRHALLHMLFPDTYECIISTQHKELIADAFSTYLPDELNGSSVDRKLLHIREQLQAEHGNEQVNFYTPEFKRRWQRKETGVATAKTELEVGDDMLSDPLLQQLSRPLGESGQMILYGPPGTGKTYYARRLAEMMVATNNFDEEVSRLTVDERDSLRLDHVRQEEHMAWWCVANPERWSWQSNPDQDIVDFDFGRIQQSFQEAQVGDLVFCYESTPTLAVTAIARVHKALHQSPDGPVITLKRTALLDEPIAYSEIQEHPVLSQAHPVRLANRGTLFRMETGESKQLVEMIKERNPNLSFETDMDLRSEVSYLRMCTFHPAFGYEEFIEGYRPEQSADGAPHFAIKDGIFKRLCKDARQQPNHAFVLIIDEINRGNIPRIFGELITLIEKDKRWSAHNPSSYAVELPASGDSFTVPENVYIIATMNTADKSIAVLDTALRRRFSFREFMPDPRLLGGVDIEGVSLDKLLSVLNEKIVHVMDRNFQIGHAYFLHTDGEPISTPTALATVLRDKVLPLLQDYCYDDYSMLEEILGAGFVDSIRQQFHPEIMNPEHEGELLKRIGRLVDAQSGAHEP